MFSTILGMLHYIHFKWLHKFVTFMEPESKAKKKKKKISTLSWKIFKLTVFLLLLENAFMSQKGISIFYAPKQKSPQVVIFNPLAEGSYSFLLCSTFSKIYQKGAGGSKGRRKLLKVAQWTSLLMRWETEIWDFFKRNFIICNEQWTYIC